VPVLIRRSWKTDPRPKRQGFGSGLSSVKPARSLKRNQAADAAFQNVVRYCFVRELVSGGESGEQLYKELRAAKLNGVDFQSAPADEAQGASYGFWRLDAARAASEQAQARG
jgi:hypothetical protein